LYSIGSLEKSTLLNFGNLPPDDAIDHNSISAFDIIHTAHVAIEVEKLALDVLPIALVVFTQLITVEVIDSDRRSDNKQDGGNKEKFGHGHIIPCV
jgi:hypothetical protein